MGFSIFSLIFYKIFLSFCQFLIFAHSQVPEDLFHGLKKVTAWLLVSINLVSTV